MRPPDERQTADLLGEMRVTLDRLEGLREGPSAYTVLRVARLMRKGAYRRSSGFDGSRPSEKPDPTGDAATDRAEASALEEALGEALNRARLGLRDALRVVSDTAPPLPGPGNPMCVVHLKAKDGRGRPLLADVEEGKEASERCWWCNDFRQNYGEDPIPGLLEAKDVEYKRITTKVIREEYAKVGREPPVSRKSLPSVRKAG